MILLKHKEIKKDLLGFLFLFTLKSKAKSEKMNFHFYFGIFTFLGGLMEKPPMEWIDKLFNCMSQFYGERWTKQFTKMATEDLAKTIWQSALQGLTYEQIKHTLVLLKRAAQANIATPPNFLEFYRYAKGSATPHIDYEANTRRGDPEIARRALDEIRGKLNGSTSLKAG